MFRAVWALIVVSLTTSVLGTAALCVLAVRPGSEIVMRLGRIWSRLNLRACGIRTTYRGLENATGHLPCVFISNHQSYVDIWATIPVLPLPARFVAKKSTFSVPFLGWCLAASGFIPVDRKNRARAFKSLEIAAEKIRAGRSIFLFAEGTRSRDGRLGRFKKGAFHLALKAGVPVIPVAISGTWKTLPPGSLRPRPGEIQVTFAPPLDVSPYAPDDVQGLMSAVRHEIASRLDDSEVRDEPAVASAGSSP